MLISVRLSKVLLGWDVMDSGAPWQPEALENIAHWQGVIRNERQQAYDIWAALKRQNDELTPDKRVEGVIVPLPGDEPIAPDAPITAHDRRDAYNAAWRGILRQLPSDFKQAIDEAVLDDFLGARWRMNALAIGSPAKAKPENSPGSSGSSTA